MCLCVAQCYLQVWNFARGAKTTKTDESLGQGTTENDESGRRHDHSAREYVFTGYQME